MHTEDIFALGLGLQSPWKLTGQQFDMEKHPHELRLSIGADRGALYPCRERAGSIFSDRPISGILAQPKPIGGFYEATNDQTHTHALCPIQGEGGHSGLARGQNPGRVIATV